MRIHVMPGIRKKSAGFSLVELPAVSRRESNGFSLVELFAAMAILMIIVTMMGIIFTDSDRAWNFGVCRAENNTAGRAAVNMIAHDLQYAAADDILTFAIQRDRYSGDSDTNKNSDSYGFTNSELCFVSLQHDSSDGARTAREIYYYVKPDTNWPGRYTLQRGYYGNAIAGAQFADHCYYNRDWYKKSELSRPNNDIIAENVAGFAVYAPDPSTGQLNTNYYSDATIWPDSSNRLPMYVDVYLELLNEREAIRAANMKLSPIPSIKAAVNGYVETNVWRYTTRVYFHNRNGYNLLYTKP